jgi:hypothetical protein
VKSRLSRKVGLGMGKAAPTRSVSRPSLLCSLLWLMCDNLILNQDPASNLTSSFDQQANFDISSASSGPVYDTAYLSQLKASHASRPQVNNDMLDGYTMDVDTSNLPISTAGRNYDTDMDGMDTTGGVDVIISKTRVTSLTCQSSQKLLYHLHPPSLLQRRNGHVFARYPGQEWTRTLSPYPLQGGRTMFLPAHTLTVGSFGRRTSLGRVTMVSSLEQPGHTCSDNKLYLLTVVGGFCRICRVYVCTRTHRTRQKVPEERGQQTPGRDGRAHRRCCVSRNSIPTSFIFVVIYTMTSC